MIRSFLKMPVFLKLLTASTVAAVAFSIESLLPGGSLAVFGKVISASEWWSSGAGYISALTAVLFIASALLMLARSRLGRPLYLIGWLGLSVSIPTFAIIVKGTSAGTLPSMIINLFATALIAFYLYKNRAVKDYFATD